MGTATSEPTSAGESTGTLPSGSCRSAADCENIEDCVPPGAVTCGGATGCTLDGAPCNTDPECGGTPDAPQICVPDPCCGMSLCQPGCLGPADCGPAAMCGADARCVPATCTDEPDCPANYSCTANTCAQTPCDSDAQCDGFCVNGGCQPALGYCMGPAA
ncbi:hypothetical protein [Nannocystis sp.]|uniref:hypothetical protein n=1 Tax=Nannocystis sp. TaxID=1962667 RepID=UPI0025E3BFAB|nr:hypothetical protein [Nannocystis sp.]MBK7830647.1 hypothetical protein [Nannocystis sp.]